MGHPNDRYIRQYLVAFSGSLSMFASSAAFAWVSPMLPKLTAADSPIPLTSDEAGWVVFAVMIGRIISVIPGAWAMDRFGRKPTVLASAIPMLIGWIVLYAADNVTSIYVFRALAGLTLGVVHTVVMPMYLAEIGSDKIRGSVCSIHGVMAKSGICFSFALGPFLSFQQMSAVSLLPISLFLLTFFWCPESPYWLLAQRRTDDAFEALVCLRGHREVEEEFKMMEANTEQALANPIAFRDILRAENRPGLVVTLGLAAFIVLTGTEAALAFSQTVFIQLHAPATPELLSLITGLMLAAATICIVFVVDRVGRRPILLATTVGLFVCNVTIALFFVLQKAEVDISATNWIPMLAVMVFVCSYGCGLATVAFAVIGEILPKDLKAPAGVVFGVTVSVLSMIVMKSYQVLADSIGHYFIYVVFSVFSAALFPFIWFYIPETKGKPLHEILAMMKVK